MMQSTASQTLTCLKAKPDCLIVLYSGVQSRKMTVVTRHTGTELLFRR